MEVKYILGTSVFLILGLFALTYSSMGVGASYYLQTLQTVTDNGDKTSNDIFVESDDVGSFGYYVRSNGYSANPVLSLRNFNQSEKGFNMIVYARNYTGTVAGYPKNESVRMWSVGSTMVLGTYGQEDLVLASNDLLGLKIDGTNQNIYVEKDLKVNGNYTSSDGSIGWTGSCGGPVGPHANKAVVVKNGIVVDCV